MAPPLPPRPPTESSRGRTTEVLPPADLSGAWGYSRSKVPVPRYLYSEEEVQGSVATKPAGFYSGVTAAGDGMPPMPARTMGEMPAELTWTGFERDGQTASVFVQLSAEAPYEVQVQGNRVVVVLPNTRVRVRNNARYLDLRYFGTPLQKVMVRRKRETTSVVIDLNTARTPQVDIRRAPTGYYMLVVSFALAPPTPSSAS